MREISHSSSRRGEIRMTRAKAGFLVLALRYRASLDLGRFARPSFLARRQFRGIAGSVSRMMECGSGPRHFPQNAEARRDRDDGATVHDADTRNMWKSGARRYVQRCAQTNAETLTCFEHYYYPHRISSYVKHKRSRCATSFLGMSQKSKNRDIPTHHQEDSG